MPPNPQVSASEIPVLTDSSNKRSSRAAWNENRLRQGYDRDLVEHHLDLVQVGQAPTTQDQNVERSRTSIVGPPPNTNAEGKKETGPSFNPKDKVDRKGKGRQKSDKSNLNQASGFGSGSSSRQINTTEISPVDPRDRGSLRIPTSSRPLADPSTPAATSPLASEAGLAQSASVPSGLTATEAGPSTARSASSSSLQTPKSISRGRRAYNSAMSRLSNFATAMMDVGLDQDSDSYNQGAGAGADGQDRENPPRATYNFSGDDGGGVDLTKGRVRMTVNLPLVTSSHSNARRLGTPQLVSDFETPFVRIRHKLRVKLGFGFSDQPLGMGTDGMWGQALVMCVPVSVDF